jgi:hypothetical protein
MDNLLFDESEILAALRLLFAPDTKNYKDILESVEESEIKRAFRKRAMQTHPDRFVSSGAEYQKRCSERFIAISNAYEILNAYLKSRDNGFSFRQRDTGANGNSGTRQHPRKRQSPPTAHSKEQPRDFYTHSFWQKDVPRRHLRFGEFLYYSGAIPWKILIRALVWQVKQRPRIGEIAQKWRWLNETQITNLLNNRHPGERLGELLLHHGMISPFQLTVLLWQQKRIQKPIGEYFVQQRLLSEGKIQEFLRRQQKHNFIYYSDRPVQPNL